jgi:hypothetical protein
LQEAKVLVSLIGFMDNYIKIFITGWLILIVAILINIVEIKFGIYTWYSFIQEGQKIGFLKAFIQTSLLSKIFLFLVYPFLLGLVGYFFLKR